MIHHPDKKINKDDEFAAEKFREITEAYEILGNFRLRKLYDKGIIHTASEKYSQKHTDPDPEEDPTTRFYKGFLQILYNFFNFFTHIHHFSANEERTRNRDRENSNL